MSGGIAVNHSMTPLEWGFLITLSVLWGGSYFFVEIALRDLPVFTIVFARLFLGGLALLAVMALAGNTTFRDRRILIACFIMGLFNNAIPFVLLVWGQAHLDSGVAALLVATTPLFTIVLAHFLTTDERMTLPRLLGIGFGILGVVMIIGVDFSGSGKVSLLASLSCLVASLSYGIAGIFGRRLLTAGIPLLSAATGQVLTASLLLLPLVLFIDQPWKLPLPRTSSWAALLAVGLFSTALAYFLYFRILSTAGATNLLLVTLLVPVSALLLGIGILGEHLLPNQFAGMFLIGSGLIIIDGRLWRLIANSTVKKDRSS